MLTPRQILSLVRATGTKRRRFIVRGRQPLKRDRDRLLKVYMGVVRHWQGAVASIVEQYERQARIDGILTDSAEPSEARLRDSADDVIDAIDDAASWFETAFLDIRIAFADWAEAVELWQRSRFAQSIFSATGVDQNYVMASLSVADVQTTLNDALAWNISLIKSVNDQQAEKMKAAIFAAYQARENPSVLAKKLNEITSFGTKRSRLIAQDQLTKLSGQMDRERTVQVGMTDFIWKHSGKLHPRPWHKARDGKQYSYVTRERSDGEETIPADDMPSIPVYCGCTGDSVLDLDAIERELAANGQLMSESELSALA